MGSDNPSAIGLSLGGSELDGADETRVTHWIDVRFLELDQAMVTDALESTAVGSGLIAIGVPGEGGRVPR
jgi:hypothetical protein